MLWTDTTRQCQEAVSLIQAVAVSELPPLAAGSSLLVIGTMSSCHTLASGCLNFVGGLFLMDEATFEDGCARIPVSAELLRHKFRMSVCNGKLTL